MTEADKKTKIIKMQNLMTEIVKAYTELIKIKPDQGSTNDLKSPGTIDGTWGGNTNNSYESILKRFDSPSPKNIDEAILNLYEILISLNGQVAAAKNNESTSQAKTSEPAAAITDDQAKEAFRGLLDSIQSGRIKLKAGGDNSVFKQRISRDWGAIIRAYNGPQGVVDAFYGELKLTDPEKAQLVNINEKGLDGTLTVVGKINQKFLEAINTYIKPFGRALRTEKGMARVIKRRQQRRNSSLERLNILSKVAQRKEVARERLEKKAFLWIPLAAAGALATAEIYVGYQAALIAVKKINEYLEKDFISKDEFDETIGEDRFRKIMNIKLIDWVSKNDPVHQGIYLLNRNYNYKPATEAYALKNKEISDREAAGRKFLAEDVPEEEPRQEEISKKGPPRSTPGRPTMDTSKLRDLLTTAEHPPGNGAGWDQQLNDAFVNAYNEWRRMPGNESKPEITKGWKIVAPQLDLDPNISGAEALVGRLINLKRPAGGQTSNSAPPAPAPAPTAAAGGQANKQAAVSGLQYLFNKILTKEVKVDQDRFDFIRDSKNFRGVIRGLGGAGPAAEYCVNNCGFDNQEMNNIAKYNKLALDQLGGNINRSGVLAKIFNTFKNIKEQSRRPFRRGIREDVLAENVKLWLQGQGEQKGAKASISKSIEMRKMAARKKLGLQS